MLEAEWKRIINEIEKAIKKTAAALNEGYERHVKENNALIAAPLNSLTDQFDRYKEQQRTNDRDAAGREVATIIGVFLTAFFTLAAAAIFYWQLMEQRNEFRIDKRAWVGVPFVRIISPLTYSGEGETKKATVRFEYNVKNLGRTPATEYILTVEPFVKAGGEKHFPWTNDQEGICKAQLGESKSDNYVILPDERWIADQTYDIPVGTHKSYTVSFVGCSMYKITGDDEWHQTGIIFVLAAPGLDTDGSFPAIDVNDGTRQSNQLQIGHRFTAGRVD